MKTILTILSALFTLVSVNAQGTSDIATLTTSATYGNKTNIISSEQTFLAATVYNIQGADKQGITIMHNDATSDLKIIFKTIGKILS